MNTRTAYIQVLILLTLCLKVNASSSLPACPSEESAIPLDAQTPVGLSGNELLTRFFPPQVSFRWRNKPQTTASIRFVPSSNSVRMLTWSRGQDCATPSPSIFIDGVLTIQAADGSANTQCATSIEANLVDGAIEISTTCDALEQLPGPPLSHEFWTDFLLSMKNGQLSGEITRMYLVDEGGGTFRGEDVRLATIRGMRTPLRLDEDSDHTSIESDEGITEDDIVGTFRLTPREPQGMETQLSLPYGFTFTRHHAVDFIFDGEPSIVSQCETSWILRDAMLRTTLDCTSIFPTMKPMVMELDLSSATRESLSQARGVEISAAFNNLLGTDDRFQGMVLLTRVPQGPLDLSEMTIISEEGTGLKRGDRDPDIGCCLDDACDTSLPCHDVELGFDNGRIGIRLVFDENIENLTTLELFQNHLRQAYLSVNFKTSSREIEWAQVRPIETTVFKSFADERVQFSMSGIIDTLRRHWWEGGIDGRQVYEEVEVSIPYNINFDLEILKGL